MEARKNCLTRFLRSESNLLLPHESINQRGFPHIGPPENGKLGPSVLGAVLGLAAALHEFHLLNLGVARVRPDHDVGPGKDHVSGYLLGLDTRRDEQDLPGESSHVSGLRVRSSSRGGGGAEAVAAEPGGSDGDGESRSLW